MFAGRLAAIMFLVLVVGEMPDRHPVNDRLDDLPERGDQPVHKQQHQQEPTHALLW